MSIWAALTCITIASIGLGVIIGIYIGGFM